MDLHVVHHGVDVTLATSVATRATDAFHPLFSGEVTLLNLPRLPENAWNPLRRQWCAEALLQRILDATGASSDGAVDSQPSFLTLVLADVDCFVDPLSSVFGVAHSGQGCFVGTSRIGTERELVQKVRHFIITRTAQCHHFHLFITRDNPIS